MTIWASDKRAVFASHIFMIPEHDRLSITEDGNLVLTSHSHIIWQTSTSGKGNYAALEDNGALVVYNRNNEKLWSSLDENFDLSKSK